MIQKARSKPMRVVFPEGERNKILRACQILVDEQIASPILLGDSARIRAKIAELHLHLGDVPIVEPTHIAAPRLTTLKSFTRFGNARALPVRKQKS